MYNIHLKLDDDNTEYRITVENPEGLETGKLKGKIDGEVKGSADEKMIIPIEKDGRIHKVNVTIISD